MWCTLRELHVLLCLHSPSSGSVALGHHLYIPFDGDVQRSVSSPAAGQVGQVEPPGTQEQRCVLRGMRKWTEGRRRGRVSFPFFFLFSFPSTLPSSFPPHTHTFLKISLPLSIPQTPSPLFLSACMVAALPPKTAFKLHLLHLLRARLLHFVNSLNNYLMTRVGPRSLAVSCYTVLHNVSKCAVSVTTSWQEWVQEAGSVLCSVYIITLHVTQCYNVQCL